MGFLGPIFLANTFLFAQTKALIVSKLLGKVRLADISISFILEAKKVKVSSFVHLHPAEDGLGFKNKS